MSTRLLRTAAPALLVLVLAAGCGSDGDDGDDGGGEDTAGQTTDGATEEPTEDPDADADADADPEAGADDGPDPADAPTDASVEAFCEADVVFSDQVLALEPDDSEDEAAEVVVGAHRDQAEALAEVGTPDGISEAQRRGFELTISSGRTVTEQDYRESTLPDGPFDYTPEEQADVDAYRDYVGETCFAAP